MSGHELLFARHAKPTIVVGSPAADWALSPTGIDGAMALGDRLSGTAPAFDVWSSAETKAIETATLLELGTVTIDQGFGEVAKPWYDSPADHETAACRYLAGEDQPGWETRSEAVARFGAAVERAANQRDGRTVIATHGTVLSLWLSTQVDGFDAVEFWLDLRMPDAWWFDGRGEAGPIVRRS